MIRISALGRNFGAPEERSDTWGHTREGERDMTHERWIELRSGLLGLLMGLLAACGAGPIDNGQAQPGAACSATAPCAAGSACNATGTCVPCDRADCTTCADDARNGDETDRDCGGACARC